MNKHVVACILVLEQDYVLEDDDDEYEDDEEPGESESESENEEEVEGDAAKEAQELADEFAFQEPSGFDFTFSDAMKMLYVQEVMPDAIVNRFVGESGTVGQESPCSGI